MSVMLACTAFPRCLQRELPEDGVHRDEGLAELLRLVSIGSSFLRSHVAGIIGLTPVDAETVEGHSQARESVAPRMAWHLCVLIRLTVVTVLFMDTRGAENGGWCHPMKLHCQLSPAACSDHGGMRATDRKAPPCLSACACDNFFFKVLGMEPRGALPLSCPPALFIF